jgi:hypothetical protein
MQKNNPRGRDTSLHSMLRCCACVIVLLQTARAGASERLVPTGGSVITLDAAGLRSTYYRLQQDSVLELKASGPGTLAVIMRLALPAGFGRDSAHFRMVVTLGADTARDVRTTTTPDAGDWLGRTEQPSVSQTLSLPVQVGRHTYRFHLSEADGPYAGLQFILKRSTPRGPAAP